MANRTRYIGPIALIILVVAVSVFGMVGCLKTSAPPKTTTTTTTIATSTAKTSTTPTTTVAYATEAELANLKTQVANITSGSSGTTALQGQITSINAEIAGLQAEQKTILQGETANNTTIGPNPVTINGLSFAFLYSSVFLPVATASTPASAEFAVKIENTNSYSVNNLVLAGVFSFSTYPSAVANNYPQLTDDAGAVVYNEVEYNGASGTTFTVRSTTSGSTPITLAAGSSIILYPKLTMLAAATYTTPATTVTLKITGVVYDEGK
jgi:hypothetical protein